MKFIVYNKFQVRSIKKYHGNKSKIDPCTILKENSEEERLSRRFSHVVYSTNNAQSIEEQRKHEVQIVLDWMESHFLTRLKDDTFRGLINFHKVRHSDATYDDIAEALVSKQF